LKLLSSWMGYPNDGILLIDKEEGETSFGVVKKVRSAFKDCRGLKVGHAGTLDPFATGLLIVLLGQGTKLSHFIMREKKAYLATLRLGIRTDTLDPTGCVLSTSPVPDLSLDFVRRKAQDFVGEVEQIPPIFSAIKYKGTRAYKLARKGTKIDLQKRTVTVYSLKVLSLDLPDILMEMVCSSGTYVRSLAADLGNQLGPGGHLKSLRRQASGPFKVQDAIISGVISSREGRDILKERVIPLAKALPGMREVEVSDIVAREIRRGRQQVFEALASGDMLPGVKANEDEHFKLVARGKLIAIVKANVGRGGYDRPRVERVFS
jgi:tRNA pseudouridine55 synthase